MSESFHNKSWWQWLAKDSSINEHFFLWTKGGQTGHSCKLQGTTWTLGTKGSIFPCHLSILSDNMSMKMTVFSTPVTSHCHWHPARTASVSLPTYHWDSKDAYHSFSIFWCTLENWLLLNCIPTDSNDHLWYLFATLRTKSLAMYAQWMPTGDKEEWRATKVKASAFPYKIQEGMTHDVSTHVWLEELQDVVARPGEDPQDLVACIKTLMDCCKMINDEHQEHELHCHIVHAYCHEGKLLDKLMAKSFKTPSSELTDIAMNHFAIQHAQEQVSHSSKPVDTIQHNKHWGACTSHDIDDHTPPASSRDCPNAHDSTHLTEQNAPHGIPDAPNATRLGTRDQNAMVASHLN